MHARFILIAATLVSTSAWSAEPSKPAPQAPAHNDQPQPKVVLASADNVRDAVSTTQEAPATPKRRLSRVTSCRCGDQEAQPDE